MGPKVTYPLLSLSMGLGALITVIIALKKLMQCVNVLQKLMLWQL